MAPPSKCWEWSATPAGPKRRCAGRHAGMAGSRLLRRCGVQRPAGTVPKDPPQHHRGLFARAYPTAAIRASRASPPSRRRSRSCRAANIPTDAPSTPGSIFRRPPAISTGWPTGHAVTGVSRACTGCSMSNSRTICRVIAAVTAAKTWPSCAASHLASFAPTKPSEASKPEENQQAGIRTTSSSCSSSNER